MNKNKSSTGEGLPVQAAGGGGRGGIGELTQRPPSALGGQTRRNQRPALSGRPSAPKLRAPSVHPSRPPLPGAGSSPLQPLQSPAGFREEPGTGPGNPASPLYLPPAPASSCRAAARVTAAVPSASQLPGPRPARSASSHLQPLPAAPPRRTSPYLHPLRSLGITARPHN